MRWQFLLATEVCTRPEQPTTVCRTTIIITICSNSTISPQILLVETIHTNLAPIILAVNNTRLCISIRASAREPPKTMQGRHREEKKSTETLPKLVPCLENQLLLGKLALQSTFLMAICTITWDINSRLSSRTTNTRKIKAYPCTA